MKIGVFGSGGVAQTLAAGFIKHGHQTMMGTRDNAKLADWLKKNPTAQVGSFIETAAFGDVVVLAVKGSAAPDVLRVAGSANLAGKLVMDACNPIADAAPVNGVLKFFTTLDNSLMEQLQKEFPTAHFVKAFNSVGQAQFVNPQYESGRPTMFICGDDDDAKASRRRFSTSSAGIPQTWAKWKRRAPLSRFACCGAFWDLRAMNGPTRSNCCANDPCCPTMQDKSAIRPWSIAQFKESRATNSVVNARAGLPTRQCSFWAWFKSTKWPARLGFARHQCAGRPEVALPSKAGDTSSNPYLQVSIHWSLPSESERQRRADCTGARLL
jgi:8-hydroxy-5-deazaflavin:NADPH oxidoreductase